MKTKLNNQPLTAPDGTAPPIAPAPPIEPRPSWLSALWARKSVVIATFSMLAIGLHLMLRFGIGILDVGRLPGAWAAQYGPSEGVAQNGSPCPLPARSFWPRSPC